MIIIIILLLLLLSISIIIIINNNKHIKDSMCLPHIRLQLFTLTPIFFYYITHVHLLQFSPPSIPDIIRPPRALRGSAIHVFLIINNNNNHNNNNNNNNEMNQLLSSPVFQ